ncbi:MAG: flagellar basal body L-ring protein FlgH [Syntrophobacteraceae bacterium]
MKRYRILTSRSFLAALLVLALSGCAGTNTNKDTSSLTPPKMIANSSKLPLPEAGPQPGSLAPNGSLWAPSSGSLYADLKAAKVGDIITITVSEESKGSKAASTVASKDKTMGGQFSFAGAGAGAAGIANPKGAAVMGPYSGQFTHGFNGSAQTTKTDSMTAYMTATVVDVLPNGNMLIRGSRWTKVNDEMQQMIMEGVVRPADINRNNSVLSQNVAEAKIFLVGKGPVSQHQKPGWLNQVIDVVSPF